jgi:hypothetical protein
MILYEYQKEHDGIKYVIEVEHCADDFTYEYLKVKIRKVKNLFFFKFKYTVFERFFNRKKVESYRTICLKTWSEYCLVVIKPERGE